MRCVRYFAIGCLLPVLVFIQCTSGMRNDSPKTISLWNGKDFTGWAFALADSTVNPLNVWSVQNGVIRCVGKPNGYMYTTTDYANYVLTVEWRWPGAGGNSGVFTHAQAPFTVWPRCIECQLQSGNADNFVIMGVGSITVAGKPYNNTAQFMGVRKMADSSEKPLGEWNTYRIIRRNDTLTCYVNDVLQNEGSLATFTKGRICLQSEGSEVEFRNVRLELLP